MSDDPAFDEAQWNLQGFAAAAATMARLAKIDDHLTRWTGGDHQAGVLAADALDQLDGLLSDDLAPTRKAVVLLLQRLPPPPTD